MFLNRKNDILCNSAFFILFLTKSNLCCCQCLSQCDLDYFSVWFQSYFGVLCVLSKAEKSNIKHWVITGINLLAIRRQESSNFFFKCTLVHLVTVLLFYADFVFS